MTRRFASIWFRHLSTDWFTRRQPELKNIPFVLRASHHGRIVVTAANTIAERRGIHCGMVVNDARAVNPDLEVRDDDPALIKNLLTRIAEWCIQFSPIVALDLPEGLLLETTGCAHLWGGEVPYVNSLFSRLTERGYDVRIAMADTIGLAWGVARFGKPPLIIDSQSHTEALVNLPPEALRLESETIVRLHKLGLHRVGQFMRMPRASLRKRFGPHFISRLDMAIGQEIEMIEPVQPVEPYQERLPCFDPIVTAPGIAMALHQLLERLCNRLQNDHKGLRSASLKGYRMDGKVEKIEIGTHRASHHAGHLFKLFEFKIASIEPALGIELFLLEAPTVEDYYPQQEKLWEGSGGLDDNRLSELIDHLSGRLGTRAIHRYLPDEHYWPERSFKLASVLTENPASAWRSDKLRPIALLPVPEPIEVTAPIPDYPPMLFRRNGKIHHIVRADGPERIEQEWWLQQGQHRDYYRVEDETGHRFWLFRLGHYDEQRYQWFIHGFFA